MILKPVVIHKTINIVGEIAVKRNHFYFLCYNSNLFNIITAGKEELIDDYNCIFREKNCKTL